MRFFISSCPCKFWILLLTNFAVAAAGLDSNHPVTLTTVVNSDTEFSTHDLTAVNVCCNSDFRDLPFMVNNETGGLSYSKLCGTNTTDNNVDGINTIIWEIPGELMYTGLANPFILKVMHRSRLDCIKEEFTRTITYKGFYPNGYLEIGNEFYAPDEYCIDGTPAALSISVAVCKPDCGGTRACIPKCCRVNKVYNLGIREGLRGCHPPWVAGEGLEESSPREHYFNPPLYLDLKTKANTNASTPPRLPHFIHRRFKDFRYTCRDNATLFLPMSHWVAKNLSLTMNDTFHSVPFRIRQDGTLLLIDGLGRRVERQDTRFCVDGIQDYGGDDGSVLGFRNTEDEYGIFMCAEEQYGFVEKEVSLIYGILLIVFSVFPLLTCGIYTTLWGKHNVHGWTIATAAGSLFLMYVGLGIEHILHVFMVREDLGDRAYCTVLAILNHLTLLSAFSWMTVTCFDIWLTVRSMKPLDRKNYKGRRKYAIYSLVGWSYPLVIVGCSVVLHFYYKNIDDGERVSFTPPGYGLVNCSIVPDSQRIYIVYPTTLLLAINLGLFTHVCFKLLSHKRELKKLVNAKSANNWKDLWRMGKLFLLMGISWIPNAISSILHANTWVLIILDLVSIASALGVFVLYVYNKKVLSMLQRGGLT